MHVVSKPPDYFGDISKTKGIFQKIFEWEKLIKTKPTTVPQLYFEVMINFKVIFISS